VPLEPELVLASPLLRARETAAAIAKATGAELRIDERLAPGAGPEDVLAAIEGGGDIVVTVGHQPDCSEIAAALGAGGTVVAVGHQPDCSEIAAALGVGERDFPTAGMVEIELS